jgi:putative DNA primase/helicase
MVASVTMTSTAAKVHYLPMTTSELTNRQRLAHTFVDAEKAANRHYVWWHESWWLWKGKNYVPVSEGVIQQAIFYHVEDQFKNRKFGQDKEPSITRGMLGDVLMAVKLLSIMDDELEAPFSTLTGERHGGWHISCANGILDVKSLFNEDPAPLRNHSPNWFSPAALPVVFDEDAQCPTWDAFIREVFEGDEERVKLWEEWMGYCCVWDYSYQHSVIMVGEGRNGKGVCQKVLVELLGRDNVSSVPLGQFNERFGLQPMLGKLANIAGEIQGAGHIAEERLKQISGHDSISVNVKYGSNIEAKIPARLMFATNDVPEFKDRSKGLWRRLIIVPFNWEVPVEKADPSLADKLIQELPGIFNRALAGLYRLTEQGAFTQPKVTVEATTVYQAESNPARRFLMNQTFHDEGSSVSTLEVYQKYRLWCQQEGCTNNQILGRPQFSKEVSRYWKGKVKHEKVWQGEDRPYRWHFIGLRVED